MDPAGLSLTLDEARVARLVAEGRTDAEIARQLALDLAQVERTIADALHKLGLRSRTELALLFAMPAQAKRASSMPVTTSDG